MAEVLKLIKLGNDFRPGTPECTESDLENYRLRVEFTDKNGISVIGDLGRKNEMTYIGARGQKLKRPRVVETNKLCVSFSYYNKNGSCLRYVPVEHEKYHYTKHDVMQFISELTGIQYDRIEIEDPYGLGDKRDQEK